MLATAKLLANIYLRLILGENKWWTKGKKPTTKKNQLNIG